MGGNAKTTLYLKECMADALIKLLEEKPLEKITVPEITDLAEVGRATYFRNFSGKEELLTFKLTRMLERWKEENGYVEEPPDPRSKVYIYFQFHASIKKMLKLIYDRDLQFTVYNSFYQTLWPQVEDEKQSFKLRFFAYGVLGVVDEWVKHDFRETPEEMTELVFRFGRFDKIEP